MSFDGLNRRLLDHQLSRGQVAVQIVSPWAGIGYSNDAEEIIAWFDELDSDAVGASAIYTGVSHGTPRHTDFRREGAIWTKTADVPVRDAVFVDADATDPARPKGYCATDAEVAATVKAMDGVQARLLKHGVSEKSLVRALSGNGTNLLVLTSWLCDARTDAAIKGLLAGLAREHNTPGVSIDVSVSDRRRIRKLYGCQTRKTAAPGRPQRRSAVVSMPELSDIELCPLETIERIVAGLGSGIVIEPNRAAQPAPKVPGSIARKIGLLERWAGAYGFPSILFTKPPDDKGAVVVVLQHCPRDSSHVGTSAGLIFFPDGGHASCCQHDSCAMPFKKWWADVEDVHRQPLKFERELIRR